jgi:hypothetical protein
MAGLSQVSVAGYFQATFWWPGLSAALLPLSLFTAFIAAAHGSGLASDYHGQVKLLLA